MANENNATSLRNEAWREELRKKLTAKERAAIARVKMPELSPSYRITCNEEVNQGITEEMALVEAQRCLDCPNPQCVTGCPVGINIPTFIKLGYRYKFVINFRDENIKQMGKYTALIQIYCF